MDELINNGDTEIAAVNMRITIGRLRRTVEGERTYQDSRSSLRYK